MLRALVLALALANLGFYAWTRGWLDGAVGVRAGGDREPERLAHQVRPELVKLLPPSAVASAAAAAPPLACLEAGPFGDTEIVPAEAELQPALPPGSWVRVTTDRPGVWIVYMGKFPTREGLAKKVEELRRIHVEYEEMRDPPELQPGLSIGRFDARSKAELALAQLTQHGVHTARVVALAAPSSTHMLRVERADAALSARLTALNGAALGKGFSVCATDGPKR